VVCREMSARCRVAWEGHGRLDVRHRFLLAVAVGGVVHGAHEACRWTMYAGTLLWRAAVCGAQVPASS
jgi:hypothetical protein